MSLFYGGPALDILHEQYAKRHKIDEDAPVRTAVEVTIDAPAERVWQVLSDIEGWPAWNPDITSASLEAGSKLEVDGRFTWVSKKARVRSRFAVVDAPREVTWTGSSLGIKVVHRNTVQELPDGKVLVRSEESMAAPHLRLMFSTGKVHAVLTSLLTHLKAAAEQPPA